MRFVETYIDLDEIRRDSRFNPQGAFSFTATNRGTTRAFYDIVDTNTSANMRGFIDPGESESWGGQIDQIMTQDLYWIFVSLGAPVDTNLVQFRIERVKDGAK